MSDTVALVVIGSGAVLALSVLPMMTRRSPARRAVRNRVEPSIDWKDPAFSPSEWAEICTAAAERGVDAREFIHDAVMDEVQAWRSVR